MPSTKTINYNISIIDLIGEGEQKKNETMRWNR